MRNKSSKNTSKNKSNITSKKETKITCSTTPPPPPPPPPTTTIVAAASTTPSPPPPPTTIASLPDDVVADILLRLPSAAAIFRAVLASKHWIRVATCPTFRRRLRDVTGYPLLLGHFVVPKSPAPAPLHFQPVPLLHSSPAAAAADGVVAAMVRHGDFFLTRLQQQQEAPGSGSGRHVLEDCSGGRLLFSDRGALTVFDPMTHRVSPVEQLPRRQGNIPDHRGRTLCFLPSNDGGDFDPGAFRVMSLKHVKRKKPARLEVYDSCTRSWSVVFPAVPGAGTGTAMLPTRNHIAHRYDGQPTAMHAGDRIYWKCAVGNSLLSLDTKTMAFSDVRLPAGVSWLSAYAVGETDDGTCCLVHVIEEPGHCRQMLVWRVKGDHQAWELERRVPLILRSPSACLRVNQVLAIVGGIVLISFGSSSSYQPHVAFRLKSLKVEADFTCPGLAHPFVIGY